MALSDDQIALTAQLVRESYASVVTATSSLTSAQEVLLVDDLDLYESERNGVDFEMAGGRDGIRLNSKWLLADIFYRVRSMLGYDTIPYDQNEPVMSLMELEVGQNFG